MEPEPEKTAGNEQEIHLTNLHYFWFLFHVNFAGLYLFLSKVRFLPSYAEHSNGLTHDGGHIALWEGMLFERTYALMFNLFNISQLVPERAGKNKRKNYLTKLQQPKSNACETSDDLS